MHSRKRLLTTLLAAGLAACEQPRVSEPQVMSGDGAARSAAYAFSQSGIDWYAGDDGEIYPSSTNAYSRIDDATSVIGANCLQGQDSCTVEFKAFHSGYWHGTEAIMSWSINGNSVAQEIKWGIGSCERWVTLPGPANGGYCDKRAFTGRYLATTPDLCSWYADLTSDHNGWLLGMFSVSIGGFSFALPRFGEASRGSAAPRRHARCTEPTEQEGGGSGTVLCWEMYFVWYVKGVRMEEYVDTFCFGGLDEA
jgi:hypothetical protein